MSPQEQAGDRLRTLAARISLQKETGSPYVLLLGAGASISSGVPPTQEIQKQLLEQFGQDVSSGDLAERFDKLWERSADSLRRQFLDRFLAEQAHIPSAGYVALARLIQAGYFGLVITFNFDTLLEQALANVGFTRLKTIIRGETEMTAMTHWVARPGSSFLLLKLHGSLQSTDTFLFSYVEMNRYPRPLEELVRNVTSRPIITCGYAFNDRCVQLAFSDEGEEVVCVNPGGVPPNLRPILRVRRSAELVIDGDLGYFDAFFTTLETELKDQAPGRAPKVRPQLNPFKFLDSYDVGDGEWFFGRKHLTRQVRERLTAAQGPPPSLHLIGAEKAGKTSFVRAGLQGHLSSTAFALTYLRCRADLDRQIREGGALRLQRDLETVTLNDALASLVSAAEGRHAILVLDQFERVLADNLRNGRLIPRLPPLFKSLAQHDLPELTVVFVSVEPEGWYTKLVVEARLDLDLYLRSRFEVRPLRPLLVAAILNRAARRSGFSFPPAVVRALVRKLADPSRSFTLAHVQAVCYLLVKNAWLSEKDYRENIHPRVENALNAAINASDFLNHVEDLPLCEGRYLLRRLMKVVSEPSQEKIASFIKDHFADLFQAAAYPEPL